MMKKLLSLLLLCALPACALADVIVETPDGFRRAAENARGERLLAVEERKEIDGLFRNVGARLTLSDSANREIWTRVIGGEGEDVLNQAVPTQGGWYAAGASSSAELNSGWHGGWYDVYEPMSDGWAVRLNEAGEPVWMRCLGGTDWDSFYGLCEARDGGVILVGDTYSSDGDVKGWHDSGELFRQPDGWVVRLDSEGEIIWQRALGGRGYDMLRAVVPVEGGYLAVGETESTDGDVSGKNDDRDGWAVLLNETGELVWQGCYGGDSEDVFWSLARGEEGILAVGHSWQQIEGEDTYTCQAWAVCMDDAGAPLWSALFGTLELQHARYVTGGKRFEVAGFTQQGGGELHWVVELTRGGAEWKVIDGEM